jgi:heme exporter protein CcmD
MSDPHAGFIIAAYVLTLVVVSAMIIAVLVDSRNLRKSLSNLETKAGDKRP